MDSVAEVTLEIGFVAILLSTWAPSSHALILPEDPTLMTRWCSVPIEGRKPKVCAPFRSGAAFPVSARALVKANSWPTAALPKVNSFAQFPEPASVYHDSTVTPETPKFVPMPTGEVNPMFG